MKDRYPTDSTVPGHCLVAPEFQPDYAPPAIREVDDEANVATFLADQHVAAGRGGWIAAIDAQSGARMTFAELADRSSRLATGLRRHLGVRCGDRIAFRAPNVPDVLVVALGIWKAGAVVVPTGAQGRAEEMRHMLSDSGARFFFVFERDDLLAEVPAALEGTNVERTVVFGGDGESGEYAWHELTAEAEPLPRAPSDSVAVVWYTGGTTGTPKGCYHTHRRFIYAGDALGAAARVSEGARWAAAAPIGHALGFIHHTIFTLQHAATSVFIQDFTRPESILDVIDEYEVGTFTAIAATWARMMNVLESSTGHDPRLSSLRQAFAMWQSASSTEVYDAWRARGVELLNNFGSTAFATWVLVPKAGSAVPPGSLGRPAPGYEVLALTPEGDPSGPVAVGETGQMGVRGPTGLTYWNRPDLQRQDVVDGWTLVDDLISFDADGNATYLGRTDNIISTAGYKVAPVEVEQVLAAHRAVREVAVLAAPDAVRQEVVAAIVALREGETGTEELRRELQALVRERLAPYKYPRRLEFVDALPRDDVGKVQSGLLRRWVTEGAAGS